MNSYSRPASPINKVEDLDVNYGKYTYADYLTWRFEEMVELIRGRLFKMSPAPRERHQRVVMSLSGTFYNLLKGNPCQIYPAPFDVRLPLKGKKDDEITTVVQPDICVICDISKIDDKGCLGAPDLIIEVLSPRTAKKDMTIKKELYEEAGVKEYWIVEPNDQFIMAFILKNGRYQSSRNYFFEDIIESRAIQGLKIDLSEIFDAEAY